MRIIVTTEQTIIRKYVVEAPGHTAARDMVDNATRTTLEPYQRWQALGTERVSITEREEPIDPKARVLSAPRYGSSDPEQEAS